VGAEARAVARKRAADRCGSFGMANTERIHFDVLRPNEKLNIPRVQNHVFLVNLVKRRFAFPLE